MTTTKTQGVLAAAVLGFTASQSFGADTNTFKQGALDSLSQPRVEMWQSNSAATSRSAALADLRTRVDKTFAVGIEWKALHELITSIENCGPVTNGIGNREDVFNVDLVSQRVHAFMAGFAVEHTPSYANERILLARKVLNAAVTQLKWAEQSSDDQTRHYYADIKATRDSVKPLPDIAADK